MGGVSDSRDGAVMFDLKTDGLSARKSVTALEQAVFFIGSAITATSDFPVNTTVDSRWYRTPVEVKTQDGKNITVTETGEHRLRDVMSIRHDGLEYHFPTPVPLVIEIAERKADWTAIQPSYKKQRPVAGKLLTIYLEHGVRPRNADYCFGISPVDHGGVNLCLLANETGCHALFDTVGKTGFALFYTPGKVELPGFGTLEAAQPSAVLIRDGVLYAADPMQQKKTLRFRLKGRGLVRRASVPGKACVCRCSSAPVPLPLRCDPNGEREIIFPLPRGVLPVDEHLRPFLKDRAERGRISERYEIRGRARGSCGRTLR